MECEENLPVGPGDTTTSLQLKNGYTINTRETGTNDVLTVHAVDGKLCLRMTFTPQGPALELEGVSLKLSATREIALQCDKLDLSARESISIRTGGDLSQHADGNISVKAGGALATEAFSQSMTANTGDIRLNANDDVFIDGERVRLNSPRTRKEAGRQRELEGLLERVLSRHILPAEQH